MKTFKLALAQLNPIVGDLQGNCEMALNAMRQAAEKGVDLLVFPELFLTGYPPEDLLLRTDFLDCVEVQIQKIVASSPETTIVIGTPWREGALLYNAALIISGNRVINRYAKQILPNFGVFDEKRYFSEGRLPGRFEVKGFRFGIMICEDIWHKAPFESCIEDKPHMVLSLNASPFHREKLMERHQLISARSVSGNVPVAYINLTGGQDELVFDGGSFVMDAHGALRLQAPEFSEGIFVAELHPEANPRIDSTDVFPPLDESARIYKALVTGISDYARKNGFHGAVLGLSGGIDSALTLALAVDALGCDQVEAVLMPSRYTAQISNTDALEEAQRLGCKSHVIPIEAVFAGFLDLLSPVFGNSHPDLTEENIQARCRGTLLMAISNKKGRILLTTGNKSEMSVGYATLYGDMAGGFAPLKDVPKTMVYQLARYRNSISPVIPDRVITRPPSAELRPNQLDQDSLPPYDVLDNILERYIEKDESIQSLIESGLDPDTVAHVIGMVDRNEYKRRQSPPGIKVTHRAFGRDRRFPMTNGFSHHKA